MKQPDDIARDAAPIPSEPLGTEHHAKGTVKWWRDAKGYGVISTPLTAPWDIWCHFSVVDGAGFRTLTAGEAVEVEFIRLDQESFKYVARRVRRIGSAALAGSAGLWDRSRAFALDYLIMAAYLAMIVAGGAALGKYSPSASSALFGDPIVGQLIGFLLITLPVTCYFALSEASARHATWGKVRLRLRVVDSLGKPLSTARSFGRTAAKFVPWELAHACVWQVNFATNPSSPIYAVGFIVVWLLVGANIVSMLVSPVKQTVYDRLAGTVVERAG